MDDKSSTQSNFRHFLTAFRSPDASNRITACSPSGRPDNHSRRPAPPSWPTGSVDVSSPEAFSSQTGHRGGNGDEDDPPLDAFDRELLAELEDSPEHMQRPFHGRDEHIVFGPLSTPMPTSSYTSVPNLNSVSTPSFHGVVSSPSELEPYSSPSARPKANRRDQTRSEFFRSTTNPLWPPTTAFSPPKNPSPLSQISTNHLAHCPEIQLKHAPPIVQGIPLVSTHALPDRFRSIFPFPVFNAIQSKCFEAVYNGDQNIVLSSPTGSGKTAIMELAICKLVATIKDSNFKVVYQAPTKSLCSERVRDWRPKFASLDLQCAELTGDTDHSQLRSVQNASIIITTPEKWDSMTRKWKDHMRLIQLVKLFLIDEVHFLKESRGATLEAIVSRMKSVGSNIRFIALSATVPNSEDIAAWLGRDPTNQHLPAHRERFGEEFRPVKLQKFVYGYAGNGNDFVFDKICESKLPEVITKHSRKKPIMIFCCTRNSAIATSKNLAKLWTNTNPPSRLWNCPVKNIQVHNPELRLTISTGVAFHHAGLDSSDRHSVETGFLNGDINVICCTSTLAVGVNLPCHLVIIKNTVSWQEGGCKEYSDLEMMQMLGRAGRPQFDDSAVAVILTRKQRADHYEKLVAGSEPLESRLHLNLIDHLNAEIGLGTITDVESATKWLAGTFFFVRLRRNPAHYKLREGGGRSDEEELLRQICEKDLHLLQETSLVTPQAPLKSTELGDAMARYYVKFETMKLLLSLPPKAKLSDILAVIAQADEFREIRLKAGEKPLYKEINKDEGIKFPIKIDIGLASHKISLLIQSELGAIEIPPGEQYQKHRLTFQQEKGLVMSHVNRLIRCIIDCQISIWDSVSTRNALELARSLGARVWDNSPLQMKQLEQVGIVAVRKLAIAGINSIEALEAVEPIRVETLLSRNPPFGMRLVARAAAFPKPRVSVKQVGRETKPGKSPRVKFKVEIGFMNDKWPTHFQKRPIYLCFLAETSDGRILEFRRFSGSKLQKAQEIMLSAEVTRPHQTITCSVMCDDIAGTMRQAEFKPDLPQSVFLAFKAEEEDDGKIGRPTMNISRRRSGDFPKVANQKPKDTVDYFDDILDDGDFIAAAESLDSISTEEVVREPAPKVQHVKRKVVSRGESMDGSAVPIRLDNGKWACNHKCKDKTACKHLCCREGTDRPPKIPKKNTIPNPAKTGEHPRGPTSVKAKQAGLHEQFPVSKLEVIDLTGSISKPESGNRKNPSKPGRVPADKSFIPSPDWDTVDPSKLSFASEASASASTRSGEASRENQSDDIEGLLDMDEFPSLETLLELDEHDKYTDQKVDKQTRDALEYDGDFFLDDEALNYGPSGAIEDELTDYEGYLGHSGKATWDETPPLSIEELETATDILSTPKITDSAPSATHGSCSQSHPSSGSMFYRGSGDSSSPVKGVVDPKKRNYICSKENEPPEAAKKRRHNSVSNDSQNGIYRRPPESSNERGEEKKPVDIDPLILKEFGDLVEFY